MMATSVVSHEKSGPMKRPKFLEEQIVYAMRQTVAAPVADLCANSGWVTPCSTPGRESVRTRARVNCASFGKRKKNQPNETARRRTLFRQEHAVRSSAKKSLRPTPRRLLHRTHSVAYRPVGCIPRSDWTCHGGPRSDSLFACVSRSCLSPTWSGR